MFVGCSEITVSVIVKHDQHIGIIRTFCVPEATYFSFSATRVTEKIAEFWFARGISTQAGTIVYILVFLLGRMKGGPSHQLKICSSPDLEKTV